MILGFTTTHNASVCVLDDAGLPVFASSEERFSRRKNDFGFPDRAIDYVLHHVVPAEGIHQVAVGELCQVPYRSRAYLDTFYLEGLEGRDRFVGNPFEIIRTVGGEFALRFVSGGGARSYRHFIEQHLRKRHGIVAPFRYFEHHLSHAASAYYCSPFEEALVVSLDGSGDDLCGLVAQGKGGDIGIVRRIPEASSLGFYYKSVTAVLGFTPGRHEGKVTGLAAFGDPRRYVDVFRRMLYLETDDRGEKTIVSRMAERYDAKFDFGTLLRNHLQDYRDANGSWEKLRGAILRRNYRQLYRRYLDIDYGHLSFSQMADIAAAAQQVLEEVVLGLVTGYVERFGADNIALAGGTFANVRLNQKILEQTRVKNIFIQPAMGDEGLCIGAAKLAFHEKRRALPAALPHMYLGASYGEGDVARALVRFGIVAERGDAAGLRDRIVDALVRERVVGIFDGAAEFGPRALGHRTILVNPGKREINDVVNRRLHRTEFMPFAPIVLEDCFEDIFASSKLGGARNASSFMTITLDVKAEWRDRIPGVVHVDGTARPQVITSEVDPFYHGILAKFREVTGVGCLVNTSFNMHEEPIVNSPDDALRSYLTGAVDALAMGGYWIERTPGREPPT